MADDLHNPADQFDPKSERVRRNEEDPPAQKRDENDDDQTQDDLRLVS
jgi:hypothetical protein